MPNDLRSRRFRDLYEGHKEEETGNFKQIGVLSPVLGWGRGHQKAAEIPLFGALCAMTIEEFSDTIDFIAYRDTPEGERIWGWLAVGARSYSFWKIPGMLRFAFKLSETYIRPVSLSELVLEKLEKGYQVFPNGKVPRRVVGKLRRDFLWTKRHDAWHTPPPEAVLSSVHGHPSMIQS